MHATANKLQPVVLLSLLLVLWAPSAESALSVEDWQAPGDGLLTLDTATGLKWLDVTVSQGLSWNASVSELGPGGRLEGFRRATDAEIVAFWSEAGIPNIGAPGATVANFQPVRALQQLWGNTGHFPFGPPDVTITWTTTAESFDHNAVEGTALLRVFESDGTADARVRALLGARPEQVNAFVAHALVQADSAPAAAVPESSTIVLLMAGAAASALLRARVKRPARAARSDFIRSTPAGPALRRRRLDHGSGTDRNRARRPDALQ